MNVIRNVYPRTMNVYRNADEGVHSIAAAIGDPGRSKMLFCLMDNRARTATELAIIAGVSASTTSAHLARLKEEGLVRVVRQGKHHYYTLNGADVASVLERLLFLSGATKPELVTRTADRLRAARTCYDHIGGTLGVALLDAFLKEAFLIANDPATAKSYTPSRKGVKTFGSLGIDVHKLEMQRRQLAVPCLDWSERRPHLGGALGAAILTIAKKKKWLVADLDSRALTLTERGHCDMSAIFGLDL